MDAPSETARPEIEHERQPHDEKRRGGQQDNGQQLSLGLCGHRLLPAVADDRAIRDLHTVPLGRRSTAFLAAVVGQFEWKRQQIAVAAETDSTRAQSL